MKTIIFDLDGTIADLWPLERETILRMAKNTNPDLLNKLYRQGQRNLLDLFQSIGGQKISREVFDQQYQIMQQKMILENKCPPFPIFLQEPFLKNMSGICFGLLTGSFRSEAEFVLQRTGCRKYFYDSLVFCRGEYQGEKLSGEPYLEIIKRIGSKFVMIGDSEGDVLGAARAGIIGIRVFRQPAELQQKMELQRTIRQAKNLLNSRIYDYN